MRSYAATLFQELKNGGSAKVNELVTKQITEELFLDYKQAATLATNKKLANDDRKNLAKAISGFGNSEGGVIVWGIDCRKDPKTGTEVVKQSYVQDVVQLKSFIDNLVGAMTSPPHQSVETVAIEMSGKTGVVVTYVPEGLNVPYRSNATSANGYFMRAGSSFEPVPHAVLASMFGRKPNPILTGAFRALAPTSQAGQGPVKVSFEIVVENSGRGIADDLFVIVSGKDENGVLLRRKVAGDDIHWFNYQVDDQWVFSTRETFHRLVPVAKVIIPFGFQFEMNQRNVGPITLSATCGASNSAGHSFSCTLTAEECEKIHENLAHNYGPDGAAVRAALEVITNILKAASQR